MDALPLHAFADIADHVPWLGRNMPSWLSATSATMLSLSRIVSLHETSGLQAKCVSDISAFAQEPVNRACILRHVLLGAVAHGRLSLCRFLLPLMFSTFRRQPTYNQVVHFFMMAYRAKFAQKLLCTAARNGHVHTCRWLYKCLRPLSRNLDSDNILPGSDNSIPNLGVPDEYLRHNIHLLFVKVASRGYLPVCQWLHNTFRLTNQQAHFNHSVAFRMAASNGHILVCDWLMSTFPISDAQQSFNIQHYYGHVLLALGQQGHLDMVIWLHQKLPAIFCCILDLMRTVRLACHHGHWPLCQWLLQLPDLDLSEQEDFKVELLKLSVKNGQSLTCANLLHKFWPNGIDTPFFAALLLLATKSINTQDIKLEICQTLDMARKNKHDSITLSSGPEYRKTLLASAKCGHLELCQWLLNQLDSSQEDNDHVQHIETQDHERMRGDMFLKALKHGHIYVANQLESFGITMIGGLNLHRALSNMAQNGLLDACIWSLVKFGYDALSFVSTWMLQKALFHGHLDVCRWLQATFEIDFETIWRCCNTDTLRQLVRLGSVSMIQWLTETISNRPRDDPEEEASDIGKANEGDRRDIWRSLVLACLLYPLSCNPFVLAARLGHQPLCEWMLQHHGHKLTGRDKLMALKEALSCDHLALCQWLYPHVSADLPKNPRLCDELSVMLGQRKPAGRLWTFLMLQKAGRRSRSWMEGAIKPLFDHGDWDVCLFALNECL